jgi:ABC-type multidrug transport system fused ATPase/permease subunit
MVHLEHGGVLRTFALLNKKIKVKIFLIVFVQSALGLLDLFGVLAVGALGALAIQGVESRSPGNKVSYFLRLINAQNFSLHGAAIYLGIVAASILLVKTVISIYITRKTYFFLSNISTQISMDLITKYLYQDFAEIQSMNTHEIIYIVTEGTKNIVLGILGTFMALISDISLLLILGIGLFFINVQITVLVILLFGSVAFCLHYLLKIRASQIGNMSYIYSIQNNRTLLNVITAYKEIFVKDRIPYFIGELRFVRDKMSSISAELAFQPFISKYVLELFSTFAALLVGCYEFAVFDAVHAISILGIFLVASSRIAPAAMRIQQGFMIIKTSESASESTFRLLQKLEERPALEISNNDEIVTSGFVPKIVVNEVSFRYSNNEKFHLSALSLGISAGQRVAIVGPSGSGKTTLINLILGLLKPMSGRLTISGLEPSEAKYRWPGGIAYVPQDIFVVSGSIRENVAFGYPINKVSDESIWKALETAQLKEFVINLENGIDSFVGENGFQLSGGQRQRLGLARALFSEPALLVLDEATSSLDALTEESITQAISNLDEKVTVVLIAHRLSTVRFVDKILYLEEGKLIAEGTFQQIKEIVPNFASQAHLAGL